MQSFLLGDHYEFLLRGGRSSARAKSVPEGPPVDSEPRPEPRRPNSLDAPVARLHWADSVSRQRTTEVTITDRGEEGMSVATAERLDLGTPVVVRPLGGAPLKAIVRRCTRGGHAWSLDVEFVADDKRRFVRSPWVCEGRARWRLLDGSPRERRIRIENRGAGGLRLRVEEELAPGTVIEIAADGWTRLARVANCRRDEDDFRVGVQFAGPPRAAGSILIGERPAR